MPSDFAVLVAAILSANLLTVMFLWGMAKACKIGADEGAPISVALAMLVPLVIAGCGAWLFTP